MAGFIPGIAGGGSQEKVGKSSSFYKELEPMYRQSGRVAPPVFKIPLYWGKLPFTSGPIYFGAVAVFLFLLGLLTVKGPAKWWLALGTLLTLLLSMGSNLEGFNRFFFDHMCLCTTSSERPILYSALLPSSFRHSDLWLWPAW
jgi:hypothetical protein